MYQNLLRGLKPDNTLELLHCPASHCALHGIVQAWDPPLVSSVASTLQELSVALPDSQPQVESVYTGSCCVSLHCDVHWQLWRRDTVIIATFQPSEAVEEKVPHETASKITGYRCDKLASYGYINCATWSATRVWTSPRPVRRKATIRSTTAPPKPACASRVS
jgi:hypothetical protein